MLIIIVLSKECLFYSELRHSRADRSILPQQRYQIAHNRAGGWQAAGAFAVEHLRSRVEGLYFERVKSSRVCAKTCEAGTRSGRTTASIFPLTGFRAAEAISFIAKPDSRALRISSMLICSIPVVSISCGRTCSPKA